MFCQIVLASTLPTIPLVRSDLSSLDRENNSIPTETKSMDGNDASIIIFCPFVAEIPVHGGMST